MPAPTTSVSTVYSTTVNIHVSDSSNVTVDNGTSFNVTQTPVVTNGQPQPSQKQPIGKLVILNIYIHEIISHIFNMFKENHDDYNKYLKLLLVFFVQVILSDYDSVVTIVYFVFQ